MKYYFIDQMAGTSGYRVLIQRGSKISFWTDLNNCRLVKPNFWVSLPSSARNSLLPSQFCGRCSENCWTPFNTSDWLPHLMTPQLPTAKGPPLAGWPQHSSVARRAGRAKGPATRQLLEALASNAQWPRHSAHHHSKHTRHRTTSFQLLTLARSSADLLFLAS